MKTGYCGIALYSPKDEKNWGSVLRNAYNFKADFICTIGHRYKRTSADTPNASIHIPVLHFKDYESFIDSKEKDVPVISIECSGQYQFETFVHPKRAIYLFGSEDGSIPESILKSTTSCKMDTQSCLNLATASGIVLFHRHLQTFKAK